MENSLRVIVLGGGHAGTEAAAAAARLGARVTLVTLRASDLGTMSCNPAFGGVGKGHIVREIDALDGEMARAADAAAIQYRLLNRSKGPAVRGPRVQADRKYYRLAISSALAKFENITLIEDEGLEVLLDGDRVRGLRCLASGDLLCDRLVIAGGTFLRAVTYVGNETKSEGRAGAGVSTRLGEFFDGLGFACGRLKTGTPPRLSSASIDWEKVGEQLGDDRPVFMSTLTDKLALPQVSCGITNTTPALHDLIRDNITTSPIYSGKVQDRGPRYCPSIEDKVVRFADRDSHRVYLEPEGLASDVIYPNGISTALPLWLQKKFIRLMPGLELAEIVRAGYAVAYDYFDPRGLKSTLETRKISGLFFAGQVNGTTGYEEAGAQGLLAGANAASSKGPLVLDRSDCYIGVMVDDLITRGVSEPYRMLTARAEYRLKLRADNAESRLFEKALAHGLISAKRRDFFEKRHAARKTTSGLLDSPPSKALRAAFVANLGENISATTSTAQAIVQSSCDGATLQQVFSAAGLGHLPLWLAEELVANALYSGYMGRIERDILEFKRESEAKIPQALDFDAISGLSNEVRDRLKERRPESLAVAARMEGITPEAVVLIMQHLKRQAA